MTDRLQCVSMYLVALAAVMIVKKETTYCKHFSLFLLKTQLFIFQRYFTH